MCLIPQDKEQMTTGIYSTKWFLQCFIDRVRIRAFPRFYLIPCLTPERHRVASLPCTGKPPESVFIVHSD